MNVEWSYSIDFSNMLMEWNKLILVPGFGLADDDLIMDSLKEIWAKRLWSFVIPAIEDQNKYYVMRCDC